MTKVITPSVCLHEALNSFNLPCCTGRKHHAPRVLISCRRGYAPLRRSTLLPVVNIINYPCCVRKLMSRRALHYFIGT